MMHFMRADANYIDFTLARGLIGIILAFAVGYGMGFIFGQVWQKLGK